MLEKMISVGPPLKGTTPESKVETKKDFRETSDSKAEFEKALKEKMQFEKEASKKSEHNKQKQESRASEPAKEKKGEDKDELTAKKDKKSSGGIKRKMTDDVDEATVSKIMASTESEIEIPESKIDLEQVEIGTQKVAENIAGNKAGIAGNQAGSAEVKPFDPKILQDLVKEGGKPVTDEKMQAQILAQLELSMQGQKEPEAVDASMKPMMEVPDVKVQAAPEYDQQMLSRLDQQLQAAQFPVQAAGSQTEATNAQMEKELGAAVGFQANTQKQMSGAELVQKMKSFEAEKNITAPDKALAFEQAVLDQLKKQVSGTGQEQSSNQSGAKDEGAKDASKDLKPDSIKNDGSQHAGQSHTDFKAQMASPLTKGAEAQANKLEANHEKNIQEIMSQAKFLVTKGGGEMKVSMSPEGMGEVHLKVLLQDGKLNVEIQTQDKAVKKMIEDSLSELKSGLAAHRLSVEHVRIDTVNATNTDNQAGTQSNFNQSGHEGKQREFWNQFQQNLGQQPGRSSYGGEKSASGGGTASSIASEASAQAAVRTYGGTKGATVNRVA